MKKSRLIILSSLLVFTSLTVLSKESSFKKKIGRKIASVFQEEQGNRIFSKINDCKTTKKSSKYFQKSSECMSHYFGKDLSTSHKIDLSIFILAGKNFSSLAKCDFETLERHPSVIKTENEFVLCSDYESGSRNKSETGIFFFERYGKDLKIIDIKN